MATVSGKEAALKELLACAICLNQYTDPRRLPCQHSFCKKCIDRLLASNITVCPKCRNSFQRRGHSSKGADSLPVAFDINNLLEIMSKKYETESQSSSGHRHCHQLTTVFPVCQTHGRLKDMYCDTCEDYTCLKCSLKYHHTHQCDRAELLFTKHRQQIEASLEPMKNKIKELEHTLTRFDTRKKELVEQAKAVNVEINRTHQELVNQLHESQKKLCQELLTTVQGKLQRHSVEKAKVETALIQMQSCRDLVSKELKTRSDHQIQAGKVELIKRINDTHSSIRVSKLQPSQPDTVFTADRNTVSACGSIGKITDKSSADVSPVLTFSQPGPSSQSSLISKIAVRRSRDHRFSPVYSQAQFQSRN